MLLQIPDVPARGQRRRRLRPLSERNKFPVARRRCPDGAHGSHALVVASVPQSFASRSGEAKPLHLAHYDAPKRGRYRRLRFAHLRFSRIDQQPDEGDHSASLGAPAKAWPVAACNPSLDHKRRVRCWTARGVMRHSCRPRPDLAFGRHFQVGWLGMDSPVMSHSAGPPTQARRSRTPRSCAQALGSRHTVKERAMWRSRKWWRTPTDEPQSLDFVSATHTLADLIEAGDKSGLSCPQALEIKAWGDPTASIRPGKYEEVDAWAKWLGVETHAKTGTSESGERLEFLRAKAVRGGVSIEVHDLRKVTPPSPGA